MMANRITALSALLAVIVAANAATTTFGLVTLSGLVATVKGRQWDTPSRRRAARDAPDRVRWERAA